MPLFCFCKVLSVRRVPYATVVLIVARAPTFSPYPLPLVSQHFWDKDLWADQAATFRGPVSATPPLPYPVHPTYWPPYPQYEPPLLEPGFAAPAGAIPGDTSRATYNFSHSGYPTASSSSATSSPSAAMSPLTASWSPGPSSERFESPLPDIDWADPSLDPALLRSVDAAVTSLNTPAPARKPTKQRRGLMTAREKLMSTLVERGESQEIANDRLERLKATVHHKPVSISTARGHARAMEVWDAFRQTVLGETSQQRAATVAWSSPYQVTAGELIVQLERVRSLDPSRPVRCRLTVRASPQPVWHRRLEGIRCLQLSGQGRGYRQPPLGQQPGNDVASVLRRCESSQEFQAAGFPTARRPPGLIQSIHSAFEVQTRCRPEPIARFEGPGQCGASNHENVNLPTPCSPSL